MDRPEGWLTAGHRPCRPPVPLVHSRAKHSEPNVRRWSRVAFRSTPDESTSGESFECCTIQTVVVARSCCCSTVHPSVWSKLDWRDSDCHCCCCFCSGTDCCAVMIWLNFIRTKIKGCSPLRYRFFHCHHISIDASCRVMIFGHFLQKRGSRIGFEQTQSSSFQTVRKTSVDSGWLINFFQWKLIKFDWLRSNAKHSLHSDVMLPLSSWTNLRVTASSIMCLTWMCVCVCVCVCVCFNSWIKLILKPLIFPNQLNQRQPLSWPFATTFRDIPPTRCPF